MPAGSGSGPTLPSERLLGLLAAWLPGQRWFAGKGADDDGGRAPALRQVAWLPLDPVAALYLVADGPVVYQVPVTVHSAPQPELEHALVGVLEEPGRGAGWVYDGPRDPAFVRPWLRLIAGGRAEQAGVAARGVAPAGGPPIDPQAPSCVVSGEQSNTSVIVGQDTEHPLMVKLFRVVSAGDNPDVVVAGALAAAGSQRVPRPAGWIEADWIEPTWTAPGGMRSAGGLAVRGHWAFAAEFLPGSRDAWRIAIEAVAAGQSFAESAEELGAAVAQVHAALAAALPTQRATAQLQAQLADGLATRVGWAVSEAPVLQPFEAAARAVMDAVRGVDAVPDLQRVHGDCHLGQVLYSPTRGWVLLDFEGEPLRPLAERSAPELALRDVAGMLRSFDYAARHATIGLGGDDPRLAAAHDWAAQAQTSFLDGYARASGRDPRADDVLLRALELDKAMYEVVYELRNRPLWVGIPMAAVHRLLPDVTA